MTLILLLPDYNTRASSIDAVAGIYDTLVSLFAMLGCLLYVLFFFEALLYVAHTLTLKMTLITIARLQYTCILHLCTLVGIPSVPVRKF